MCPLTIETLNLQEIYSNITQMGKKLYGKLEEWLMAL